MPRKRQPIAFAPEAIAQLEGAPVTLLTEPEQQDGDYLATEPAWGELPKILPLPDLAAFLAHELRQNPEAILSVLEQAIRNHAVEFFGLSSTGEWVPGMSRAMAAMRVLEITDNEDGESVLSVEITPTDSLHLEAMGMEPGEVLRLWVRRGGTLPENLKRLVEYPTEPTKTPAKTDGWKESARALAKEYLEKHWQSELHPCQEDTADAVASVLRKQKIYGPQGKPLSGSYIKRNALQGDWWKKNGSAKKGETGET